MQLQSKEWALSGYHRELIRHRSDSVVCGHDLEADHRTALVCSETWSNPVSSFKALGQSLGLASPDPSNESSSSCGSPLHPSLHSENTIADSVYLGRCFKTGASNPFQKQLLTLGTPLSEAVSLPVCLLS